MSVRIGFGMAGFPFSSPAAFLGWIDQLENSPADSVWLSERLVSPAPILEPMSALAIIAGRTKRLKFGMNAVVLPFRDPLILAKECATIDFLSDGRLLPVFGVGSDVAPEFRATSRKAQGRGALSDEILEIMTRLWSEDHVSYEGKHFQYRDVTISPKPKQAPLPLWIGGSSDAAIRRTATLGSGWLSGIQSPRQVAPVVTKIRAASAEAGRPLDPDHYGAGFGFRFGSWDDDIVQRSAAAYARLGESTDPKELLVAGSAADIIQRAREYHEAGISKFVCRPLATGEGEIAEQTQRLIDEVMPEVHNW